MGKEQAKCTVSPDAGSCGSDGARGAKERIVEKIMPAVQLPARKKVAAYCRISMGTERLQHSLAAQVSHYSRLIQSTPGWEYAGVFSDEGVTGTQKKGRGGFAELMQLCESHAVDIILCKSVSRFARNTVDLLETIRHLKDLGISVRFEKEHIDTLKESGEILLTLLATFSQEESRSISENEKWGIRKMYEKGKARNVRLYGYRIKDGRMVIYEDEAETVRRIFKMYLEGDSCFLIAEKLNDEGIPSTRGARFSGSMISLLLRNIRYTGDALCQKYFTEDFLTHRRKRNKGELPMYLISGANPAIIGREIFDAVQKETADRYGVAIVNGIAEPVRYFGKSVADRPDHDVIRKAQWSDEQRKRQGEIHKNRETMSGMKYPLSLMIKCEVCGQNLSAKFRKLADGTRVMYWYDHSHYLHVEKTDDPGSGRPVCMDDEPLKALIADVLHMDEFDGDKMCGLITHISVFGDVLTFHFRDGHTEQRTFVKQKTARMLKEEKMRQKRKEDGADG